MEKKELTGMLYDVRGFALQDGPGIRTTVYLKGCPLRCPWCRDPDLQLYSGQLDWASENCLGTALCKDICINACDRKALGYGTSRIDLLTKKELRLVHIERDLCDNCGKCADTCFSAALSMTGKAASVDELLRRLLKDRLFYDGSGGGVTVSGGECLCQGEFTLTLLKELKKEGINTAVCTSGYVKWDVVESVLPYTDLFIYDIRHMDSRKHRQTVGVPNELILNNARKIALSGGKLRIRVQVVPMFNNDTENIRKTAKFCKALGNAVETVRLMPCRELYGMKYLKINGQPAMAAIPPSDEQLKDLKKLMESYDLPVSLY